MDLPTLYCESLTHSHEYINSISNIAFLLGALWLRPWRHATPARWVFSACLVFIGLASFAWHLVPSSATDLADTLSIALFVSSLLLFCFRRLLRAWWLVGTVFLLVLFVSLWLESLPWLNGGLVYIFLFTLIAGVSFPLSQNKSRWSLAVFLAFLGLFFRTLDPLLCGHFHWGLHFLWHVCVAGSSTLLVSLLAPVTAPRLPSS